MAKCGRNYLLEVYDETADVWRQLGSARSDSLTQNNEQVDTSNKSETPWRALSTCGVRSVTITSSGVMTDVGASQAIDLLQIAARLNQSVQARMASGALEIVQEGGYRVPSFERNGEHNGAEEYSVTLEGFDPPTSQILTPGSIPGDVIVSVRLVNQDYTGPCMRIRRASDNAEQDIDFTVGGWVDQSAMQTFCGGSQGFVTTWYSQFTDGTPNHFVQANASYQFAATDASGVPFVDSDGNPYVFGDRARLTRMETETDIQNGGAKLLCMVCRPLGEGTSETNQICGQASGVHNHEVDFGKGVRELEDIEVEGQGQDPVTVGGQYSFGEILAFGYAAPNTGRYDLSKNGNILTLEKQADSGGSWWDNRKMRLGSGQFTNEGKIFDGNIYEFGVWTGEYPFLYAQQITAEQASAFAGTV